MTFDAVAGGAPYGRSVTLAVSQRTFKWPQCPDREALPVKTPLTAGLNEQLRYQRLQSVSVLLYVTFSRFVCSRGLKMSDDEDLVQRARAGFEELCRALNMDEEASSEAWKTYQNISTNFTLEVTTGLDRPNPPRVPLMFLSGSVFTVTP